MVKSQICTESVVELGYFTGKIRTIVSGLQFIHAEPLTLKLTSRENWFGAEENDRRATRKWSTGDLHDLRREERERDQIFYPENVALLIQPSSMPQSLSFL